MDVASIYNYNKNEDTEILTIGERKSLRFVIEDSKISEFEEIDLKIDDLENLEEYDFSDMKTVGLSEDNLKEIFLGTELYEEPNFLKKEKFFDDKNLKKFFPQIYPKTHKFLGVFGVNFNLYIKFLREFRYQ